MGTEIEVTAADGQTFAAYFRLCPRRYRRPDW